MNNKKGISLIALIITIVVLSIITATVVVSISGSSSDANLVALESDMSQIKDNVYVYYNQNGKYPLLNENEALTKDEINASTNSLYKKSSYNDGFYNQATLQNDDIFYKIDLDKIDILETKRGKGKDTSLDYYILALPSGNIYYMQGLEYNNEVKYSLDYMLGTSTKNIEEKINSSTNITDSSDNITIYKYNEQGLGINITTNMSQDEKLYLVYQEEFSLTPKNLKEVTITTDGINILKMDDISKIYNPVNALTMETGFVTDTKKVQKLNIIKKKNGNVVSYITFDMSRYVKSELSLDNSSQKTYILENKNIYSFRVNENVKEVKYDYLKRYDFGKESKVLYYENVNDLSKEKILSDGKDVKISSDGLVEIDLENEISDISFILIDKDQNISNVYSYDVYQDMPYIDVELKEFMFSKVKFELYVYCSKEISNLSYQVSNDGINYLDEVQITDFTKSSNVIRKEIVMDKNENMKDKIYLKIKSNNNMVKSFSFDI